MGSRHSVQIYVKLKDPNIPYSDIADSLADKFWQFGTKVSDTRLEANQRFFAYYLIGKAFGWDDLYTNSRVAEAILSSTRSVECNNNITGFKIHTKFTHALGKLCVAKNSLEIICKDDEKLGKTNGKNTRGFGFMTSIWNNNLPEITHKDIEKYGKRLTNTVEKYPKAAEIAGIQWFGEAITFYSDICL